jgi:hypothetical protein
MAIVTGGIFGLFSGPIGNIVGYHRKGVQYVRIRQTGTRTASTEAQVVQRAKFAKAIQFVSSMSKVLAVTYRRTYLRRLTPCNYLQRYILKNALTGEYPQFDIDYAKVPVSLGKLYSTTDATVRVKGCLIKYSWSYEAFDTNSNGYDKCVLVVYCEALNRCIYKTEGARRYSGNDILEVKEFQGKQVHTWLSFISADGKEVANSIYTGRLMIC